MLQNLKVLLYHRIVLDEDLARKHWTCVSVDRFSMHLRLLEKLGFTTITFDDYRLSIRGELDLPRKPIILTFDDGYLDTYELAFPVLREFGMKAVVFALGSNQIKTNYWDQGIGLPLAPLMEMKDLRVLQAAGCEIGSHTMTHPNLASIDEDLVWEEISHSKMALEAQLGSCVYSFAYPYGCMTPRVKEMVVEAGYSLACGVFTGPASWQADMYDIRRIAIPGSVSPLGFAARLMTPFEKYEWIQWKTAGAVKRNGNRKRSAQPHNAGNSHAGNGRCNQGHAGSDGIDQSQLGIVHGKD